MVMSYLLRSILQSLYGSMVSSQTWYQFRHLHPESLCHPVPHYALDSRWIHLQNLALLHKNSDQEDHHLKPYLPLWKDLLDWLLHHPHRLLHNHKHPDHHILLPHRTDHHQTLHNHPADRHQTLHNHPTNRHQTLHNHLKYRLRQTLLHHPSHTHHNLRTRPHRVWDHPQALPYFHVVLLLPQELLLNLLLHLLLPLPE